MIDLMDKTQGVTWGHSMECFCQICVANDAEIEETMRKQQEAYEHGQQ